MADGHARVDDVRHGAAVLAGGGTSFRVWAPGHSVELVLFESASVELRRVPMGPGDFHEVELPDVGAGALYAFSVDGGAPLPDPASRFQPFGPLGPSEVVELSVSGVEPCAVPLELLSIYELHVGTATPEGTFRALVDRLDGIADLGVTAIELLPVAEFAAEQGWGCDVVAPFAPHHRYGTPRELAALIDAAHTRGLSVILDVVYTRFALGGDHLRAFSPHWFTPHHETAWGQAIDYEGPHSAAVRAFVLDNVRSWIADFRVDGLRLAAPHELLDAGTPHILNEIVRVAHQAGEGILVLADDDRNDAKLVTPPNEGGRGLSAVWADDFCYEVRRLIAGDEDGCFVDYRGTLAELVELLRDGWLYQGQLSRVHRAPRGTPVAHVAPARLVFALQNHEQVGRRPGGDRLHHAVDLARVRAATVLLLSLPYTPLLFAGQEFLASTRWPGTLDWSESERAPGREMRALHRALLGLRRDEPAMRNGLRASFDVAERDGLLLVCRRPLDARDDELTFVIGLVAGGRIELASRVLALATEGASYDGRTVELAGPGAVVLRRARG